MAIKYEVSHTEYSNVGGYKVPVQKSDGVFDSSEEAVALADRLRRETRRPHFITATRPPRQEIQESAR